jgi:hypothetical protein
MQGAQIMRNEAYIIVRCNDEGCSGTQQNDFFTKPSLISVKVGELHRKSTPSLRRRSQ